MRLAVIPARGGSKRIPRKNIRPFFGRPMIAWSIDAALKSGCFDRIIVSTDDAEIAEVARSFGAEVPFIRPAELSDDHAGTTPVVAHATEWCAREGAEPSHVCCIYATAPFVRAEDIRTALSTLKASNYAYCFSVTSFPFPIQRAIRITSTGTVEMIEPKHWSTRSQDLEETYHDAGQFYWGTVAAWLEKMPIFGQHSLPLILPRYRVQDIDTLEDWERAERMFAAQVER